MKLTAFFCLVAFFGFAESNTLNLVQVADSYLWRLQQACLHPYPWFVARCYLVRDYARARNFDEKQAVLCRSIEAIESICTPSCQPFHVCMHVCLLARPYLTRIKFESCGGCQPGEMCSSCSNYRLEYGEQVLKDGDVAYIDSEANMPDIVAKCDQVGPAYPRVDWSLEISPVEDTKLPCSSQVVFNLTCSEWAYNSKGVRYCVNFPTIEGCPTTTFNSSCTEWHIQRVVTGDDIRGGHARLGWNGPNGKTGSIEFEIRLQSPTPEQVLDEIHRVAGDEVWFAEYIGQQESHLQHVKNDCPLVSRDKGYGMFQLTIPNPSCSQIWSWKQNIADGISRLRGFLTLASEYMKTQRILTNEPIPEHRTGNCVFKEGTSRPIEHAVAMKRYNGASCHKNQSSERVCDYIAWNKPDNEWTFYNLNRNNLDYVNELCKKVPVLFN